MKIVTTVDVNDLLGMYIASVALDAALELGLFWRLAEEPMAAEDVTKAFGIPFNRCQCWLELLIGLGLLERRGETYGTVVSRERKEKRRRLNTRRRKR